MSEIWKPQSNEIYRNWLNSIIYEASEKLNNWETDFIHSISNQLDNGRILTEKQVEILERIYSEKTK